MVAYTIGNVRSYDKDLVEKENLYKVGRSEDYPGGWVWKTIEEVQQFIKKTVLNFQVGIYEIELPNDWATDVSQEPGKDGVYNLLNDALIVRKVIVSELVTRSDEDSSLVV